MRESQNEKVWKYLQTHEKITTYEMFDKFNICRASARIKDLRDKYGFDVISDRWITKKRKEYNGKGKEQIVTMRYKEYFLKKMEG